jgi:uncharacterized DUF497 family protein
LTVSYGWNPAKRASNIAKHGVDFAAVEDFDWETALVEADTRRDYGEVRLRAMGSVGERLHVLVYTIRRTSIWVISLRRASNKEIRRYAGEG